MTDQSSYAEFLAMLTSVNAELSGAEPTERGTVLVAAAVIEECIGRTLSSFLVDCDETSRLLNPKENGALSAVGNKINACVALGLLPQSEARVCRFLLEIRNSFAHRVEAAFDNKLSNKLIECEKHTKAEVPEGLSMAGRYHLVCTNLALHIALRWDANGRPQRLKRYPDPIIVKIGKDRSGQG